MICDELKRTIFANGGLGLLQMVLELNTEWCANKDAELPRRIKWCANKDVELPRKVNWVLYKSIETSP